MPVSALSSTRGFTVWNMDHDRGLGAPHAAGVVAGVALRGERDAQPADGPVLQEIRLDAENASTTLASLMLVTVPTFIAYLGQETELKLEDL